MVKYLLIILLAALQEQSAATALFLAGKSQGEAFLLTWLGSSLTVVLCYFFPEEVHFLVQVFRKILRIGPGTNFLKENFLFQQWQNFQQQMNEWIKEHHSPQVAVFLVAAIPIPGLIVIAIVAARIVKLRWGFGIVFTANVFKTYILVIVIYHFGSLFGLLF